MHRTEETTAPAATQVERTNGSRPRAAEPAEPETVAGPPRAAGLQGRTYSALFRGDLQPERIIFYVEDRECWVDLLRMDKSQHDEFIRKGGGETTAENFAAATDHLVGVTVQGFLLWKQIAPGQWQQVAPPAGAKPDQMVKMLRGWQVLPEFFDDLFAEVCRVNAARVEDEGNAPAP